MKVWRKTYSRKFLHPLNCSSKMILFCHKLIKYNYMFDIILFNDFMLRQSINFSSFVWFWFEVLKFPVSVMVLRPLLQFYSAGVQQNFRQTTLTSFFDDSHYQDLIWGLNASQNILIESMYLPLLQVTLNNWRIKSNLIWWDKISLTILSVTQWPCSRIIPDLICRRPAKTGND